MACGIVAILQLWGSEPLILVGIDEPLNFARHPAGFVEILRADELLDQPLLVLGVQDLKSLRQPGLTPVQAQEPMSNAVECPDPQAASRNTQQLLDAAPHLARGFVRERHGQNAVRRGASGLDDPNDAVSEDARLAAARAGQHQHRPQRGGHSVALCLVQRIQERGQIHRGAHYTHALRATSQGDRCATPEIEWREARRKDYSLPTTPFSANCSSAAMKPSSTGPITRPRIPKAEAPPMAPTNTAIVDTSACVAVRYGRRKLSMTPTPALQTARKIAAPQCPSNIRYSTAGTSTRAEPTGRNAVMVASTPNTTGDGRPTNAKPIPENAP